MTRSSRLLLLVALPLLLLAGPLRAADLSWQPWGAEAFAKAKAEGRFVLLDLEAVWCHWCHVMHRETYADTAVAGLIRARYVPVRADQDAHPDLSARYGDWGWPATIVLSADGAEIVKLRGFVPPARMASILQAIIDDPTPGPSARAAEAIVPAQSAYLSPAQRRELEAAFMASFDRQHAGWGDLHKFIPTESMDLAMTAAMAGNAEAAMMARRTLDAALALIDREWGGVYQYSDRQDWQGPHYEKIMQYQATYLRHYAQAYALWGEARHLAAARDVHRYLTKVLLSPEGAFYTSQDADVDASLDGKAFYALDASARAKLGRSPRVDKSLYARENGWAASGLVAYYNATGEPAALLAAERAMRWVIAHRALPGGGYRHGERDRGGPFLSDTLAVGQAALDLYGATGERDWLRIAREADGFIAASFKAEAGFATTKEDAVRLGAFSTPHVAPEEMVALARLASLLHHVAGSTEARASAEHAMRWLAAPANLARRGLAAGILLADSELANDPMHITIAGPKRDAKAAALHAEARRIPAIAKRLDWWDRAEGPLPNPDVEYPDLGEAAAFACANQVCSLPVFEPAELAATVARMREATAPRR